MLQVLDNLGCTSANKASLFAFGLHKISLPKRVQNYGKYFTRQNILADFSNYNNFLVKKSL